MFRARVLPALVLAMVVFPLGPALADDLSRRSFYLGHAGEEMVTEAPSGADPTLIGTLEFEAEDGAPYFARTMAFDEPIEIVGEGAFHLRLFNREPTLPVEHTYVTAIRVSIYNDHRGEFVPAMFTDETYRFGVLTRAFEHPGSGLGETVEGWTDFRFDANPMQPRLGSILACNNDVPRDCMSYFDGVMRIPRGFRLVLEFGLLADGGVPQAHREIVDDAADLWIDAGDLLGEHTPLDPDRPIRQLPQVNLTRVVEAALRAQGGADAARLVGFAAPASSWRVASAFSDSRLDVRMG